MHRLSGHTPRGEFRPPYRTQRGTPTTSKMCGSLRILTRVRTDVSSCRLVPPMSVRRRPALTTSWPKMAGHREATSSSKQNLRERRLHSPPQASASTLGRTGRLQCRGWHTGACGRNCLRVPLCSNSHFGRPVQSPEVGPYLLLKQVHRRTWSACRRFWIELA
jgi:hypothetical protein